MKDEKTKEILQQMLPYLDNAQMAQLKKVLEHTLWNCTISEPTQSTEGTNKNAAKTELFLASKRVEGCSEKSLAYYKATIATALGTIDKDIRHIETEDLRKYLTDYQLKKQSSKVTIDNIRRILSSFFSWLEDEDYILKILFIKQKGKTNNILQSVFQGRTDKVRP